MRVSKSFKTDFDYLANHFKWEGAILNEMKEWIRETPEQNIPYIENLASQWRKAEGITC